MIRKGLVLAVVWTFLSASVVTAGWGSRVWPATSGCATYHQQQTVSIVAPPGLYTYITFLGVWGRGTRVFFADGILGSPVFYSGTRWDSTRFPLQSLEPGRTVKMVIVNQSGQLAVTVCWFHEN